MSTKYAYGWSDPRMPSFEPKPDYYMRRFYGKYHIFDKDGKRVASRLTKEQADAYMKLLKED